MCGVITGGQRSLALGLESEETYVKWYYVPFPISLEILLRSKVDRMRSSTACERSIRRLWTRFGSTRKLYAVWRDDASKVWS